ncbi:hypothetical protein HYV84_03560 [Candidatus Woesearchaeota archaeon]|nr:hypothetical protein [Candidatus Woesearchaeota archaeon]
MKLGEKRDIILIICAVVFVSVYSFSSLAPVFLPSWYFNRTTSGLPSFQADESPSLFSECLSKNNTHLLTVSITNFRETDLENITCNLLDKGGLISSEESQTISSLSSGSSDICSFSLKGKFGKPLRVEVAYDGKSRKEAVQCYPSLS